MFSIETRGFLERERGERLDHEREESDKRDLDKLSRRFSFTSSTNHGKASCLPGTRVDVLEKLSAWATRTLQTRNSAHPFLNYLGYSGFMARRGVERAPSLHRHHRRL